VSVGAHGAWSIGAHQITILIPQEQDSADGSAGKWHAAGSAIFVVRWGSRRRRR